jgi:Zn-dependent peptidase ImmA (M78 family)
MAFRWGFKTEANTLALEVRTELGLHSTARLDPWELAAHLDIQITPLSSFNEEERNAVRYLSTGQGAKEFSAMTIFDGTRRLVVYNDRHAMSRQANDITHELAHALLGHVAGPALDSGGCRYVNKDLEDEASFLAGALLVTDDIALSVAGSGMSDAEAAREYGVSALLMRWRVNMTGARKRVSRGQRFIRRGPRRP